MHIKIAAIILLSSMSFGIVCGDDITDDFFNKAMGHGVEALYQNAKEKLHGITPNDVHEYKKKRDTIINLKILNALAKDTASQHACLKSVQSKFEKEGMLLQASIISDFARHYITPEHNEIKSVERRTEEMRTKIIHDLGKILQYAHTKMGLAHQMPTVDLAEQLAVLDCSYKQENQSPEILANNANNTNLTFADQAGLASKTYFGGDLQQLMTRLQLHLYNIDPQGNLHLYVYILQEIARRAAITNQFVQQTISLENEKKRITNGNGAR